MSNLQRNLQRLDKVLAHLGLGSRKAVRQLIRRGVVLVGDEPVADPGHLLDPRVEPITVKGQRLTYQQYHYLMLNKPAGVLSATEDRRQPTVLDLIPEKFRRRNLFPVGRLDKDTEGLLLITDHGALAHRLLAPRWQVSKRYLAQVAGDLDPDVKATFATGVTLDDGYVTKPAALTIINQGPVSTVELVIYEGKFHQVKRMFAAVGGQVTYLKRLAMGPLTLDERLAPGQVRPLTAAEIAALLQVTDLN